MADRYREFVDRFVEAMFGRHDAGAAASLYTEDALLIDPGEPEPVRGRAAVEKNLAGYLQAFPDASAKITNVFGAGDWLTAELEMTGTHTGPLELSPGESVPGTGRRITMQICWVARLTSDGRCIEDHTYYDSAGLMQQLGLFADSAAEVAGGS